MIDMVNEENMYYLSWLVMEKALEGLINLKICVLGIGLYGGMWPRFFFFCYLGSIRICDFNNCDLKIVIIKCDLKT